MKKRNRLKKDRNLFAVAAQFRNSAGPMRNKRKWHEDEQKTTKEWLIEEQELNTSTQKEKK